MGHVEKAFCLPDEKLLRFVIRHHYYDETEKEKQRYGIVASHSIGDGVASHSIPSSRYLGMKKSVLGEERLLVIFRQADVAYALSYPMARDMQCVRT